MMKHVTAMYPRWREAGDRRRRDILRHLEDCPECRRYFEEMDRFLDPSLLTGGPQLQPDPYLPQRVAQMSGMRKRIEIEYRPGRLFLVLQGAAFAAAVAIGILIGMSLPQEQSYTEAEEIVELIRDAVHPEDDAVRFEAVLDESEGGQE